METQLVIPMVPVIHLECEMEMRKQHMISWRITFILRHLGAQLLLWKGGSEGGKNDERTLEKKNWIKDARTQVRTFRGGGSSFLLFSCKLTRP